MVNYKDERRGKTMKTFHFNDDYALICFDGLNVNDPFLILNSKSFEKVFRNYHRTLKNEQSVLLVELNKLTATDLLDFYKLLFKYELSTVLRRMPKVTKEHVLPIYELTESFYDYWRKYERYGLLNAYKDDTSRTKVDDLLKVSNDFNHQIITIYRTISQKLLGEHFHVYRQLPAGISANMLYTYHAFDKSLKEYKLLNNIPVATKIVINPPFIINSKSNVRSGVFSPLTYSYNPITHLKLKKDEFIAFPLWVGPLLTYIYIHIDFLHHGIALANLFEIADYQKVKDLKPDLIYIYGVDDPLYDCKFYHDTVNDIYLGFVGKSEENDYFGYVKKMLLTLHNLYMINHDNLPVHGAMVELTLNNDEKKRVVIVGDSGAGKSETLEALRQIGRDEIKDMKVIFDDMGALSISEDNKVVASGTEIGAFVRIDDLDKGYAYEVMDRALFLNPSQINARVVMPLSRHSFITLKHPIDIFLYANNYEDKNGIKVFNKWEDALNVFKKGMRKAKGTTSEVGMTTSYFANPFGPMQYRSKTNRLLNKYFAALAENDVIFGELYTKVAITKEEIRGPSNAALALLKLLQKSD